MDPITIFKVQHQIQNIIYQAEISAYTQRPSTIAAAHGQDIVPLRQLKVVPSLAILIH